LNAKSNYNNSFGQSKDSHQSLNNSLTRKKEGKLNIEFLNSISVNVEGENPLTKIRQLKFKKSEFDMQLGSSHKCFDFVMTNAAEILKDTEQTSKLLEILQRTKDSNNRNLNCINELYIYNFELLLDIERRIQD